MPGLTLTKAFSRLFDNNDTHRSSFSKTFGISSRDSTNLLLVYTKELLQFLAKLELSRRASEKGITIEPLVTLHNKSSDCSELVYQYPVRNDYFEKCDD